MPRRGRWSVRVDRQDVGRAILLGLEILIIADIVQTITIDPTLESALTLGIIVLVRTFLSFSLEIELNGTLPWRGGARPRLQDRGALNAVMICIRETVVVDGHARTQHLFDHHG